MGSFSKFFDLVRASFRQAFRRRRRYFGVISAIVFGTAAFILIVTESANVKEHVNDDLELLGAATVITASFEPDISERLQWFRQPTLRALNELPGVKGIGVVSVKYDATYAVERDRRYPFLLIAADSSFWDVHQFIPQAGRFFNIHEVNACARLCVIGTGLAEKIFGSEDPIGKYLLIERDYYKIIGLFGGILAGDRKNCAFVPLTTAMYRIENMPPPNRLYIRCRSWNAVEEVAEAIPGVVRRFQDSVGLKMEVPREQVRHVKKVAGWIELFIHLATAVTLVIGGIGIWNGMLSSVQSRTREIGLKKAMGALDSDILIQFVAEALCLSLGSACLGIILGYLGTLSADRMLGVSVSEKLFFFSAGWGLLLALATGLAGGLYPAYRASRMEVVSALRHE